MTATSRFDVRRWQRWLSVESPDPVRQRDRIRFTERQVGLPIRVVVLALLAYQLFVGSWSDLTSARAELLPAIRWFYVCYFLGSIGFGFLLSGLERTPVRWVQWGVMVAGWFDAMMVGALTLVMGGYDSILFWIYPILIVRGAVVVAMPTPQLLANLVVTACYLWAGLFDQSIEQLETEFLVDAEVPAAGAFEPFVLRLVVLVLLTVWCYAVEVLLERQREAEDEAREFALRQKQLESTGRLAAEIAHQLKNPLAIMTNALFLLQRMARDGRPEMIQQIQILREEIGRSDRILTDLMGYARLAEGRVERLDIVEELEAAIAKVYPAAVNYAVTIERDYGMALPSLMMQRGHLSEILVNLLQNARESMQAAGRLRVSAGAGEDYSVRVAIRDSGPGIAPEALAKVFEPYFTTKEKGTGLGLAIVKHNTEIYGGTVRVESELGKGAEFVLQFPARSLIRLRK